MPGSSGTLPGPRVTPSSILFELADPDHALASATIYQEVRRPRLGPAMTRVEGGWSASLPRPPVDRLEYQLVLERSDGRSAWVPDPSNPLRAEGPFGAKSVVEMPGYAPPRWLGAGSAPDPPQHSLRIRSRRLGLTTPIQVWTSPGGEPGAELPLLVVNDGPEYARFAGLLRFLDSAAGAGELPPHHVALLQPTRRNDEYSANPAYAEALVAELIPGVERSVRVRPGPAGRVCMGASLGGLAMLHAHRLHPDLCAGLCLQSPSFFRRPHDDREGWMGGFPRVVEFVDSVLAGSAAGTHPVAALLTCGVVEENLVGSRMVRDALAAQGYPVTLVETRDAHNWTSWRDTFEPHLLSLLQATWG